MIKKITASALLVLANIILLAIAVIPHHHHRQLVCIESYHCINDDGTHEYNTTKDTHRHDADNSAGCILKQIIVLPSTQDRQSFEKATYSGSQSCFFLPIVCATSGEKLLPGIGFASKISQNSFSFTSCIGASLGLRAPPSV